MDLQGSILEWDEYEVHLWLSKLGLPQYEAPIREHHITGDILAQLDLDTLKEIGITTIGQRLQILKAVYQIKVLHGVEIEPGHYVPPSELDTLEEPMTLERLHTLVKEQNEKLRLVEEDNRRLNEHLAQVAEELVRMSQRAGPSDDRTLRKQPSFRWANLRGSRSPTRPDQQVSVHSESPHPSPQRSEYDLANGRTQAALQTPYERAGPQRQGSYGTPSSANTASTSTLMEQTSRQLTARPDNPPSGMSTSTDNLKSFKVSLEDPAWKVLPAALKKYKINNDDWQNYAMFICYGQTERCLSYDEKPLLLFQKLKDAKKNPVFMLKHIKDIRSPIAVAQQKHAARKASEGSGSRPSGHGGRNASRPMKLNTSTVPNTSHAQPGWPEIMSPSTEQKDKLDEFASTSDGRQRTITNGNEAPGSGGSVDAAVDGPSNGSRQDTINTGISYAVAIYPYMAEQDDEFDVIVGDSFIILSRARGWWVVQRDPSGNGIVDADTSKQGWVPAGCLLETNVPVASAIAEANASRSGGSGSSPQPSSETPILPLSILSTSFPGIALMDYRKKGDEELDLVKDDLLRVFKRYNHWSYAVKEDGGHRGWVPSWFIGKVTSAGQVPTTPSSTTPANGSYGAQVALDSFRYASPDGHTPLGVANQVSPMSSAFPAPSHSQQRTAMV